MRFELIQVQFIEAVPSPGDASRVQMETDSTI